MRRGIVLLLLVAAVAGAQVAARRWGFDNWGDRQGWTVPDRFAGVVSGGALWLTLVPATRDAALLASPRFQVYGDSAYLRRTPGCDLASPRGLGIPAQAVKKVRMRVLNQSPWTDGYVRWRVREQPDKVAGSARFTLQPDSNQWQDVVCHIDGRWTGTIDQIVVGIPATRIRGDIWIDWIEISDGPPLAPSTRPDVSSERVVPRVSLPGIRQADFADAFKILDECLIANVPVEGFAYPVMGPGGAYGENWWQLDSSLNAAAAKWTNQSFAEGVVRGFRQLQAANPDGRIDLYGGSAFRGQVGDQSSMPKLFELAWDVARRTSDAALREQIYELMKKYLDWWLSPVKRHASSGLVTAVFEETFGEQMPLNMTAQAVAAVDLNVMVALGCKVTARLARHLGREGGALRYERTFDEIAAAMNRFMWDDARGVYYNYDVREAARRPRLLSSSFDPLCMRIAPPERAARLVKSLTDPAQFNWGKLPVTSIARTEPDYVEATGPYDGRAWFGDIWTLRNMTIVTGLEDSGWHDQAAELAWATIKAFNANYSEFLVPSTGKGQGVKRYGWSAAQYIQAIIEHLFGVDYDRLEGRLRIFPRVPQQLVGAGLALNGLILPAGGDTRLDLRVKRSSAGEVEIHVDIRGSLPAGRVQIVAPQDGGRITRATDERGMLLPLRTNPDGLVNAVAVELPVAPSVSVRFH
jgi:hypothetical protein